MSTARPTQLKSVSLCFFRFAIYEKSCKRIYLEVLF